MESSLCASSALYYKDVESFPTTFTSGDSNHHKAISSWNSSSISSIPFDACDDAANNKSLRYFGAAANTKHFSQFTKNVKSTEIPSSFPKITQRIIKTFHKNGSKSFCSINCKGNPPTKSYPSIQEKTANDDIVYLEKKSSLGDSCSQMKYTSIVDSMYLHKPHSTFLEIEKIASDEKLLHLEGKMEEYGKSFLSECEKSDNVEYLEFKFSNDKNLMIEHKKTCPNKEKTASQEKNQQNNFNQNGIGIQQTLHPELLTEIDVVKWNPISLKSQKISFDIDFEEDGRLTSRIRDVTKEGLLIKWKEQDMADMHRNMIRKTNKSEAIAKTITEKEAEVEGSESTCEHNDRSKDSTSKKAIDSYRKEVVRHQIKEAKQFWKVFREWVSKDWIIDDEEERMWKEAEKRVTIKNENTEENEDIMKNNQSSQTIEELKRMLLEMLECGLEGQKKEELEKLIIKKEKKIDKKEREHEMTDIERYDAMFKNGVYYNEDDSISLRNEKLHNESKGHYCDFDNSTCEKNNQTVSEDCFSSSSTNVKDGRYLPSYSSKMFTGKALLENNYLEFPYPNQSIRFGAFSSVIENPSYSVRKSENQAVNEQLSKGSLFHRALSATESSFPTSNFLALAKTVDDSAKLSHAIRSYSYQRQKLSTLPSEYFSSFDFSMEGNEEENAGKDSAIKPRIKEKKRGCEEKGSTLF
ncbi:uncharacterized protein MONOS_7625 [Monocercomonoides exilis]|uniref:uncharacterized protein n=1 Tax=Monocercomonoides exilis TaxID=2049356 RepID=UPI00355A519E|nr:hypothetical protein MONOS_7625 [Monocercomonoides exilis]|eukprot:MONOS_7625.1-p1 / transcript=MONOS_7625.1 / gene=MONOS_7625 / organism=Monocercomonoides_exilis_PA203 / gene_product=unspecified product / transcript_product=unspecified product / location=Mono_scaffold00265:60633-62850(-) / protein_length=694 / sequence_SO=supercontig / SO=protein_coding / is_pseudo=false